MEKLVESSSCHIYIFFNEHIFDNMQIYSNIVEYTDMSLLLLFKYIDFRLNGNSLSLS